MEEVRAEDVVAMALDEVRPYLESHGGDIELLGIDDERVARLRLHGSCDGCAASYATLASAVEGALRAVPGLRGMEVEGAVAAPPERPPASSPEWVSLGVTVERGALGFARGLVVANVAGTLLAYRNACAACGARLDDALLLGGTLTCPCGAAFDLPRAGRGVVGQLEPVPLLRANGTVRVALAEETEDEHCGLCSSGVADDHRHLLHLDERRIVCVCETCWSLHSGDAEYRPAGVRTLALGDFALPDELWAGLDIPIGLAFVMRSSSTHSVVALYPSPAGATERELDPIAWGQLCALNPVLDGLDSDSEALVVNRLTDPHRFVIAPIDQCYRLVGMIKARWTGISGGDAVEDAVAEFFGDLHERAAAFA